MVPKAREKAWDTGTFNCQSCNAEVRVQRAIGFRSARMVTKRTTSASRSLRAGRVSP
jgi:hypothetical protein